MKTTNEVMALKYTIIDTQLFIKVREWFIYVLPFFFFFNSILISSWVTDLFSQIDLFLSICFSHFLSEKNNKKNISISHFCSFFTRLMCLLDILVIKERGAGINYENKCIYCHTRTTGMPLISRETVEIWYV